jgi:hypothetical protein
MTSIESPSSSNETQTSGSSATNARRELKSSPPDSSNEDKLASWRRTTAGQRARLQRVITLFVAGILLASGYVLILVTSILSSSIPRRTFDERLGLGIGALIIAVALALTAIIRFAQARIRYQESEEAKSRKAVGIAIEELKSDVSFPSLLKVNQTQMDQYHDITKHQAEDAYRNSQIAMASGLIILVLATIAAILVKGNTSKIILGGVAGVGTAFSAYIGATFLNAYQSALAQLNYYFSQPLINSYFLSAERIVTDMSPKRRDDVRAKIIDSMLQGAIDDMNFAAGSISAHPRHRGRPFSGRRAHSGVSDKSMSPS